MNPNEAVEAYIAYENQYPSDKGYEVVLIGSSEIATVRQTHSHYFGIETYSSILENLDNSIVGFSQKTDIDIGARQILACLQRRRFWGRKSVSTDTLKNHLCKNVITFESSLQTLIERKLVSGSSQGAAISLNIRKKSQIEQYL